MLNYNKQFFLINYNTFYLIKEAINFDICWISIFNYENLITIIVNNPQSNGYHKVIIIILLKIRNKAENIKTQNNSKESIIW